MNEKSGFTHMPYLLIFVGFFVRDVVNSSVKWLKGRVLLEIKCENYDCEILILFSLELLSWKIVTNFQN